MKFKLEITLDSASMSDQHDVATMLRSVADRLNRFISSNWGPYASDGKIYDENGNKVGTWEVVPS